MIYIKNILVNKKNDNINKKNYYTSAKQIIFTILRKTMKKRLNILAA